jgi:caa(3)-type oxidase subunit IV
MLKQDQPVGHGPSDHGHAHPNYVLIWAALLVLLGISLALGQIANVHVMTTLVFGIAAIKIALVMRYFMHMKFEPWLLAVLMIGAALCLVALFVGVSPDVSVRTGWSGR